MPNIAFQGFPPGPIHVKVAQNQTLAEATIGLESGVPEPTPDPEPTPGFEPKLSLQATRAVGVAPCGICLQADAEGFGVEDHYAEVRYKWSFGDPGHYTRHDTDDFPWDRVYDVDGTRYITRGPDLYLADGETLHETQAVLEPGVGYRPDFGTAQTYLGPDKDIAYGPRVAHVWENPGTYTVTCEALTREMALAGTPPVTQTLTVTVKDRSGVFAAARTLYIRGGAPAGDEPAGALVYTTFAEAWNAISRSTDPLLFLFHRGQSHTVGDVSGWYNNQPSIAQLGAYGAGTDPVLDKCPGLPAGDTIARDAAIWGIDFRGPYDSTNPNGASPYDAAGKPLSCIGASNTQGGHFTIWDCNITGFYQGVYGGTNTKNVVIGNIFIGSWFEYGVFFELGMHHDGLCGAWIKQPAGTITGAGKFESNAPFIADHGPFRCSQNLGPVSFNCCDLRSLNSWSGTFQPAIRLGGSSNAKGTPGESPLAAETSIDRVRTEMSSGMGSGVYGDSVSFPKRTVFDKMYQAIANESGGDAAMAGFGSSGVTARNTVTTIINQPKLGGGTLRYWIKRRNDPYDPSNLEYGIAFYNNTFADLRDETNGPIVMQVDYAGFSDFAFFDYDNNVEHAPNRTTGRVTTYAPLDTTTLWSVNYGGLRYENSPFDPLYAASPDTAKLFAPEPRSAAIGAAVSGRVAVDDFFGRIRGTVTAAGAVEPA